MIRPRNFYSLIGLVPVAAFACGSDVVAPKSACVPGQSIACTITSGCNGAQVCKADGSGFAPCSCSSSTSSSSASSSSSSSASSSSSSSASSSSSSGAGGTGGGMGWTPAELSGLSIWLDSDKGHIEDPSNPGTLLQWQDQSGKGNNAAATNLQPGWRFKFDPVGPNQHQAIICPGNSTYLDIADAPSIHWGTNNFTVALIFRSSSMPDQEVFYKDAQQGNLLRFNVDDQKQQYRFQFGSQIITAPLAYCEVPCARLQGASNGDRCRRDGGQGRSLLGQRRQCDRGDYAVPMREQPFARRDRRDGCGREHDARRRHEARAVLQEQVRPLARVGRGGRSGEPAREPVAHLWSAQAVRSNRRGPEIITTTTKIDTGPLRGLP